MKRKLIRDGRSKISLQELKDTFGTNAEDGYPLTDHIVLFLDPDSGSSAEFIITADFYGDYYDIKAEETFDIDRSLSREEFTKALNDECKEALETIKSWSLEDVESIVDEYKNEWSEAYGQTIEF